MGMVLQGISIWFSVLLSVYWIEYFHGNEFSAMEYGFPSSEATFLAPRHANFSVSGLNLVNGCFPKFGISCFAMNTEVVQSLLKKVTFSTNIVVGITCRDVSHSFYLVLVLEFILIICDYLLDKQETNY